MMLWLRLRIGLCCWCGRLQSRRQNRRGNIGGKEDTGIPQGNWLASLWSAPVFVLSPLSTRLDIHNSITQVCLTFVYSLYSIHHSANKRKWIINTDMYDTYVSVPVPVILYSFKKSGNSLLANICFLTCKKTFLMRLDKSWQRSIEWDILQFKYKLAEKPTANCC